MQTLYNLRRELKSKANPKKAKALQRFFKTGYGEYGEGDIFLGIVVPETRKITQKYKDLEFKDLGELLKSKIHEERLTALLILVEQFNQFQRALLNHNAVSKHKHSVVINHYTTRKHSATMLHHSAMTRHSVQARKQIFNFYLKNTKYINNWDLVDLSAPKIVGGYLLMQSHKFLYNTDAIASVLYKLVKSKNLWERRIGILSTFAFIRQNRFEESLKIAEMLLSDKHDLIHKAVGWMLREVGKRSQPTLEKFLKKHASKMPRVMLRYAIERLSEAKRADLLSDSDKVRRGGG